jgi:Asp-tRNA(Asn)/Glu-tRNA(Gln) amidotransferase A subunit family amidase
MAATPWLEDTCSLVDAFRSGERDPVGELEASLAAIERSDLNAWSYLDAGVALDQARRADVAKPLGGVPIGIKMGAHVEGWPFTEASVPLRDEVSDFDSTMIRRLRDAGAILVGQTTMSEFAGLNHTRTKLHGITGNPWDPGRTPGGSSGGSAAAVAGGLVTLATAGDGGGSTRIPAAFCGLPGLKPTYGRIPKGPHMAMNNLTAVSGCLSRSVRDIARFFDVVSGWDPRDPFSLSSEPDYESRLGTHEVEGLRVAVSIGLGVAVVAESVAELVLEHAELLVRDAGLRRVEVDIVAPTGSYEWALGGLGRIREQLGERWPECADDLTPQIRFGLEMAERHFDLRSAARIETQRTENNERMAAVFDEVDLVICATNPDVAFPAPGPIPLEVDGTEVPMGNNGALTIPANFYGNPSISIPIGSVDGLPVGMQVMARHHREDLLLDLARLVERERPWPLVAPGAPV